MVRWGWYCRPQRLQELSYIDLGLMIIITTKIVDYLENMTDVIVLAIRI